MKKYSSYLSILFGLLFLSTIYFDKLGIPTTIILIFALLGIVLGIFGVKESKLLSYIGIAINLGGVLYILSLIFGLG